MDFSQLPKMSKTQSQGDPNAAPEGAPSAPLPTAIDYAQQRRQLAGVYPVGAGSVLISLIAGVIFFAMGQTFARYLIALASGKAFATGVNWIAGPDEGKPVAYFDLQGGTAYCDLGFFLMGVALLFDAAILGTLARQRVPMTWLVIIAVALTAIAMLINGAIVIYLFGIGVMPMMSIIALLVGGFVLFDHLPLLKQQRD